MKGLNVDAFQVCRLGLIDPESENMVWNEQIWIKKAVKLH